ncbi:MAG: hypothetical protein HY075_10385 [Deltaproteobacteria bacterium]|nr:hypothetical protein [Deltaproteobacteria bacterium]
METLRSLLVAAPRRRGSRSLRFVCAVSFAAMVVVPGCSSVPDFRPSKPIEEASSLNEALDLCAAYQIKGDVNGAGRALPERTVVLVPWLRCFETIFRKFPVARERESFVMFHRALQSRHDGVPSSDARVVDWPQMNFTVTHALEHVKDPSLGYSDDEKRVCASQLPDYWVFLAESGRLSKPESKSSVRAARLSELERELGVTSGRGAGGASRFDADARPVPPRATKLTEQQRDYCKSYLAYRALVYNTEELADYKRVLEQQTRDDVSNSNEKAMRERVGARFAKMKDEAVKQRAALDEGLAKLQAGSSWFRNGYCLQDNGGGRIRSGKK